MAAHPIRLALLLAAALVAAGCSHRSPNGTDGGDGGGVVKDAAFWTNEGWNRYGTGDYADARNAFNNALDKDSTYAPAHSGAAWANIELGYSGLALGQFEEAIALDSASVDSYYGAAYMAHTQALTFPNVAETRYEESVSFALEALDRGGDSYVFSHIAAVDAISLRVLLARSYYALAAYEEAQGIVDILDPTNTLDPSAATYLLDLLLAIEDLEDLVG